jgi:hypothetical protein
MDVKCRFPPLVDLFASEARRLERDGFKQTHLPFIPAKPGPRLPELGDTEPGGLFNAEIAEIAEDAEKDALRDLCV